MKFISRLALVVTVAVVAVAAMQPAGAACPLPALINQNGADGTYGSIGSPGVGTVASLKGNFWACGFGNPTGAGADNGTWPSSSWLAGAPPYLNGDWGGDVGIDGCATTPPVTQPGKTVVALSDTDATGTDGYFMVACATKNASADFKFQDVIPGVLQMVPIPKTTIVASARAGTSVNLTLNHAAASGGVYGGDCVGTPGNACSSLLRGYKIYYSVVPRNAPAPSARDLAAWLPLTNETAIGTNSAGSVACPAVGSITDFDAYLATSLVFDSGFETGYVSGNSTVVQCGLTLADQPGNFKMIKKPKTPTRTQ